MNLIQRILHNRNSDQHELEHINDLQNLIEPNSFKDIEVAVKRIVIALQQQQSVVIIGDYDVDGASSTALAIRVLAACGLRQINYVIPNRAVHGYGLSPAVVDLSQRFEPNLLITVDNGISSHAGVDYANQLAIDVIVTDHHLAGKAIPNALAIVNPNQADCNFPSKCLAGVGVCFYLMIAVRQALRDINWFDNNSIDQPNLLHFLDLVALGTVADLVPLDSNNRLLVNKGLKLIRCGTGNCGIQRLFQNAGKSSIQQIQIADLGFVIAPRLNAAGRLDDMSLGIECLLTDDVVEADAIVAQLEAINNERKLLQKTASDDAQRGVMEIVENMEDRDAIVSLCLYDEQWHQGIVGLVASKLKEEFNRPSLVFANADSSCQQLKGSGRSIAGFHLRDALVAIDTQYPNLIDKFGGHAMAAGLSIDVANFPAFKQALEDYCRQTIAPELLNPTISCDGALSESDINTDMALLLEQYVWGQGFQEPLFSNEFDIVDKIVMAEKHLRLSLRLKNSLSIYSAVLFNAPIATLNTELQSINCYYRMHINRFRGNEVLQLLVYKVIHYS